MPKKITIDDLAVIMKKGFDDTATKADINRVESDINRVERKLNKVQATMVTKNYLDEKLTDLRGDLVVLMRKEDRKVRKLVDILKKRKVISANDEKEILSMEPFPELNLHLKQGH